MNPFELQQFNHRLVQAIELFHAKDYNSAESLCNTLLEEIPAHSDVHNLKALILVQKEQLERALASYNMAILNNEGVADYHYNRALCLQQKGDLNRAMADYQQAIILNPHFYKAYNNAAVIHMEMKQFEHAKEILIKGLSLDNKYFDFRFNLGKTYKHLGQFEKAIACLQGLDENSEAVRNELALNYKALGEGDKAASILKQMIDDGCDSYMPYNNLANHYVSIKQYQLAQETFLAGLAKHPDNDNLRYNYALLKLLREQFSSAWDLYASRLSKDNPIILFTSVDKKWQGESLVVKNIMLIAEQGLGDALLFANILPDLIAQTDSIYLFCKPRLVDLFQNSFKEITVISNQISATELDVIKSKCHYHIPFADLARYYRRDIESFTNHRPFLNIHDKAISHFKKKYTAYKKLKVGLAWHTVNPIRKNHCFPLATLAPILTNADCLFVSLQYGNVENEILNLQKIFNFSIIVDEEVDQLIDLNSYAAQIASLDLIITIDNTTAHFAGAIGIKTYLLLDTHPQYMWGDLRKNSLWYPTITCYRRTLSQDWASVIFKLSQDLDDLCQ